MYKDYIFELTLMLRAAALLLATLQRKRWKQCKLVVIFFVRFV